MICGYGNRGALLGCRSPKLRLSAFQTRAPPLEVETTENHMGGERIWGKKKILIIKKKKKSPGFSFILFLLYLFCFLIFAFILFSVPEVIAWEITAGISAFFIPRCSRPQTQSLAVLCALTYGLYQTHLWSRALRLR